VRLLVIAMRGGLGDAPGRACAGRACVRVRAVRVCLCGPCVCGSLARVTRDRGACRDTSQRAAVTARAVTARAVTARAVTARAVTARVAGSFLTLLGTRGFSFSAAWCVCVCVACGRVACVRAQQGAAYTLLTATETKTAGILVCVMCHVLVTHDVSHIGNI
jgi:hypothetical protein